MIYLGQDKKVGNTITAFGRDLTYVYFGSKLVWEGILSCFGGGFWINEKPWINEDVWKN